MDVIDGFQEFCRAQLRDILPASGNILYSSASTLKPGDIYLLGLNPGGDPCEIKHTVKDTIGQMPMKDSNSYLDESWSHRGKRLDIGQAPLQKRVDWLLTSIGLQTRSVCASNLIFQRTRSARSLDFHNLLEVSG